MENKIYDAVALGEYLIDFVPDGVSASGEPLLERNPGGAPVNVLAALAKLGNKTAFIGKVGQDPFGEYLRDVLIRQGIADKGLVLSRDAHTTMAFVHLDELGERSFHFARQPGADALLTEAEVRLDLTSGTRLFHFGSISLTSEPSRQATLHAVEAARQAGAIISYDPNWRPSLWDTEELGLVWMKSGLEQAHIVKVSEEELALLTGQSDVGMPDLVAGAEELVLSYGLDVLLVTRGAAGTYYRTARYAGEVAASRVVPVDTTGAGDAFMGAFLHRVLGSQTKPADWSEEELHRTVAFANAGGALATTRKGAIHSLGTLEEIQELLRGTR
ncbi:carbohydrate kinase family protein [Paenibacillus terricola]|uniref:carbohydrate kinase family protein n=1 Tax=Paenibacillus terricola TaxID=2763503 RepID=UPI001CD06F3E|nr:carbohydrate kinase [Paenibacillus terricola]